MRMLRLLWLGLFSSLLLMCGCGSVASRTVGYRHGGVGGPPVFSGASLDCIQMFDRESIEPGLRYHPVIAAIDTPFSFVGDIVLLPYDAVQLAAHGAGD
jgi:uncharacterized protein YceK